MEYTIRMTTMLATALVIALTGAVEASAQTNLSSAWTFTVDLNGSITGGTFVLGGNDEALNVDLDVTFKPFVDGFVGSVRIELRVTGEVKTLYLLTEATE